jgi:hypothetical protein
MNLSEVSDFMARVLNYQKDRIFMHGEREADKIGYYVRFCDNRYKKYRNEMSFLQAWTKAQAEMIENILRHHLPKTQEDQTDGS